MSELELLADEALVDASVSVAELHGAIVGIGVCDTTRFELTDLVELLGADVLSDGERVSEFVGATLDALYAQDMSFKLLLPDDDEPIAERVAALAAWSQSFLAGLVAGLARRGVGGLAELPRETRELVQDLVAVAQLDSELTDDDAESDFMQLEEYVKVGTLLIMTLQNDVDDDSEE